MKKYKSLISIISVMLLVLSFNVFAHAEEVDNSEDQQETTETDGKTSDEDFQDEDKNDESNDEEQNDDKNMSYREKMKLRWENKDIKLAQKKEKFEERRDEVKQKFEDKKEDMLGKRCENVTERITKRIDGYNENVGAHLDNYTKLTEKLNEIIAKLTEKGIDVTKLSSDLVELNNKVQAYAGLYTGFIAKLTEAKSLPCGESEGAFKQAIQDARIQLKAAIEARQEIRAFYEHTIRKDIQALRTQKNEDSENEVENKVEAESEAEGDDNE